MPVSLNHLGQIAMSVADVEDAERFYGEVLGLRKLFRFGTLVFFDCGGVRLLVEQSNEKPFAPKSSVLYFRTPDIAVAGRELTARGVEFIDTPHLIAPMPDHDLWMTFFRDPSGNVLALMQEAPKGYVPPPAVVQ